MEEEALIALLAYPWRQKIYICSDIQKHMFFFEKQKKNCFCMTSYGLRKVCGGQKACPQDILKPKPWFVEN